MMAGFTPAFQIDDSTILFRLHKAAEDAAKKVGLGRNAKIKNSGIIENNPKASFKNKNFKYVLKVLEKRNLKVLDGTMKFMTDKKWIDNEKDLKKKFGDAIFSSDDHSNISNLENLKRKVFETIVAYFNTFAGEVQSKKLKEDDLKFSCDYDGDIFKNGKAVDEEGEIGFSVNYSVGLESQEA